VQRNLRRLLTRARSFARLGYAPLFSKSLKTYR